MNYHVQRIVIAIITLLSVVCVQTSHPILAFPIQAFQERQAEEIVLTEGTPLNVVNCRGVPPWAPLAARLGAPSEGRPYMNQDIGSGDYQ